VVETLLALAFGILGASVNTPPLKEITWVAEMQTRCVRLVPPAVCAAVADGTRTGRSWAEMNTRLGFADWGAHAHASGGQKVLKS
jgi:hypothetical protein